MANLNKVILIGRLGANPTLSTSKQGKPYAKLNVATGGKNEQTQWHSVVAFGQSAEYAALYGRKGSVVFIEGRIMYRNEVNQQGFNIPRATIMADVLNIPKLTAKQEETELTNPHPIWNSDEVDEQNQ